MSFAQRIIKRLQPESPVPWVQGNAAGCQEIKRLISQSPKREARVVIVHPETGDSRLMCVTRVSAHELVAVPVRGKGLPDA